MAIACLSEFTLELGKKLFDIAGLALIEQVHSSLDLTLVDSQVGVV